MYSSHRLGIAVMNTIKIYYRAQHTTNTIKTKNYSLFILFFGILTHITINWFENHRLIPKLFFLYLLLLEKVPVKRY